MSKKEKAICQTCKEKFEFYRSTLRGKDAKYCSRDCIVHTPWNKGKVEHSKCEGCGIKIRAWRKYCTRKCYYKNNDMSKRLPDTSGESHPNWKGGKPKCLDCEKELSSYSSRYCKKHYAKHISGKNSASWKGGITSENRLQRKKFRLTIQKKVFERDNYTCQMCGDRGCALQVDHIQPWSEYVELRFDINNCRTLCMDCHYKITFGREKPEDVQSWGHNLSHVKGVS